MVQRSRSLARVAWVAIGLTFLIGCRPHKTTVSGVVTLDGSPLERAGLLFFPAAGNARTGHAITDASGRYVATLAPIPHSVIISLYKYEGKENNGEPNAVQVVPAAYSDHERPTLSITPQAGCNTVVDFTLASPAKTKQ
jgi:hypothetical protein